MISPFCPKCRAVILPGRSECPECREPVWDRPGVMDSLRKVEAPSTRRDLFCPSCHGLILSGNTRCPKCGMLVSNTPSRGLEVGQGAERLFTSLGGLNRANATKTKACSQIVAGEKPITSWMEYLLPTQLEMEANFFQIKTCDYIGGNERHRSIAENEITFEYDLRDFRFNAEAWPKDASGTYKIKYFVGKAIADRVVAAAISSADFSIFGESRLPLEEALIQAFLAVRRMEQVKVTTLEGALDIVEGQLMPLFDEMRLGAARDISNKISRYVIAHEFGHILLGHVDLSYEQSMDPDISRNNERQSDTFASNIVNTSLDQEFTYLGGLLTFLHFICIDYYNAKKESSTHPAPFERLELLLKNRSALDSFCARFRTSEKSIRNIAERLTRA